MPTSSSVGLVPELRIKVNTWYESLTTDHPLQLDAVILSQVENQLRSMGVYPSKDGLHRTWEIWCLEWCDLVEEMATPDSDAPQGDSDSEPPRPEKSAVDELTLLDSDRVPKTRLLQALASSLQWVEMLLKWFTYPGNRFPSTLPSVERWLELTIGLTGCYMLGLGEDYIKHKLMFWDALSKRQTELPAVKSTFSNVNGAIATWSISDVDPNWFQNHTPSRFEQRMGNFYTKNVAPGDRGRSLGTWLFVGKRANPKTGEVAVPAPYSRGNSFVFHMKRAAARVSADKIEAQEHDSFKGLTAPPAPVQYADFAFPDRTVAVREGNIFSQVLRTIDEIDWPKWRGDQRVYLPSDRAHVKYTRMKGGAKARVAHCQPYQYDFIRSLLDTYHHRPTRRTLHCGGSSPRLLPGCDGGCLMNVEGDFPQGVLMSQSDTRAVESRQAILDGQRESGRFRGYLNRIFDLPHEGISNSPSLYHWFERRVDEWSCRDVMQHTRGGNSSLDPLDRVPAKVIGLPEPLKVRTITAGPEVDYYWARYIQKFLHGAMREHPTFRLIGKTLSLEDIHVTFWKPLRPGEFFVSGDYKSATDLISGVLSELCARKIAQKSGMPDHIRDLFVRCLVRHMIHLPGKKVNGKTTRKAQKGIQQNGQLMGSPVSFPVLCLINAALTRYAKEIRDGQVYLLKEMALLINGDDVGFVTDQQGYEVWKAITRMGGLQFSLGKNFTSPDFLVLNSCMFERGALEGPRPMRSSDHRRVEIPDAIRRHPDDPRRTHVTVWTRSPLERATTSALSDAGANPTLRNTFFVSQWQNPDYLGPVGRFLAEGGESDISSWSKLPALRQHKLARITDIFDPENYALLPGLQREWLGRVRGSDRLTLNEIFLASWKPVLGLARCNIRGKSFSADWFLPVQLGGLGLENCSPDGIQCCSRAGRRLAKYLMVHPDRRIPSLPSLSVKNQLGMRATVMVMGLDSRDVGPFDPLPPGWSEEADVTGFASRVVWLRTHGLNEGLVYTASAEEIRAELESKLAKFNWSRRRLWQPRHGVVEFMNYPQISEKELQRFAPSRRIYRGVCPRTPLTNLGLNYDDTRILADLPVARSPQYGVDDNLSSAFADAAEAGGSLSAGEEAHLETLDGDEYLCTRTLLKESHRYPASVHDHTPGPIGVMLRLLVATSPFQPYVGRTFEEVPPRGQFGWRAIPTDVWRHPEVSRVSEDEDD